MNNSVNIWNLNVSHWQQTDVEIKSHNKCFPINFFYRTQKESLMEPLRTRNVKIDSELESQTSRFLQIPISNHHIGEKLQHLGQFHTRPALREWLTSGYPISYRAAPATSNQLRIWDLQSLPVDTTGGASKRLFTVESGSLTGRRHRRISCRWAKGEPFGKRTDSIVITIAPKKKKKANFTLSCRCSPAADRITGFFSLRLVRILSGLL